MFNLSMKSEVAFVTKVHPAGVTFILNTLMRGSYVQTYWTLSGRTEAAEVTIISQSIMLYPYMAS